MLKAITTACLVCALVLAILWPRTLASRPPRGASRAEIKAFAERFLVYNVAIVVALAGSSVGAILIMRQARRSYKSEAMENMRLMVEGTLHDHRRHEREEDAL